MRTLLLLALAAGGSQAAKPLAADFKGKAAMAGVDASAADDAKKIEDFARAKGFDVPVFLDAAGAPHARAALTAVLEGKGVSVPETAAQG